jgi:uncharacterized LabA/DUF88 family protein
MIKEFNTAILYDIENLIGGYGNLDTLSNFSLKDIYEEILKKDIGNIAIQRAYANWSNPKLSVLRDDIVELGIEPIQMFGFGKGPQKNASDIQLAIDAMDIAFTRKAIKIFIIVSGDGGFSSLAKKLHEYGYMVIGCAYKRTTNKVFAAVCDDFIWIEEPHQDLDEEILSKLTDPILLDYARKFKPKEFEGEEVLKEAEEILKFFASNKEAAFILNTTGTNISIFSQALSYRIKNFNYTSLGFLKFVDFIRYVTKNSPLKLVHKAPSEYKLLFKNASLYGFEDVEPLVERSEIHSLENYKVLLSKGNPVFRIPDDKNIVYNIIEHLVNNREKYQNLHFSEILEDLEKKFTYEQSEIKNTTLSLVNAGCFSRKPEDVKLSEQKLYFLPVSKENTILLLKNEMRKKLENLIGEVKEDIFSKII